MGFLSFLRGRDMMGHEIKLTYKGNDTHKTMAGAIISIIILVLVAMQLVKLTVDLVDMNDPSI